jgi:hypothetical protein
MSDVPSKANVKYQVECQCHKTSTGLAPSVPQAKE